MTDNKITFKEMLEQWEREYDQEEMQSTSEFLMKKLQEQQPIEFFYVFKDDCFNSGESALVKVYKTFEQATTANPPIINWGGMKYEGRWINDGSDRWYLEFDADTKTLKEDDITHTSYRTITRVTWEQPC